MCDTGFRFRPEGNKSENCLGFLRMCFEHVRDCFTSTLGHWDLLDGSFLRCPMPEQNGSPCFRRHFSIECGGWENFIVFVTQKGRMHGTSYVQWARRSPMKSQCFPLEIVNNITRNHEAIFESRDFPPESSTLWYHGTVSVAPAVWQLSWVQGEAFEQGN